MSIQGRKMDHLVARKKVFIFAICFIVCYLLSVTVLSVNGSSENLNPGSIVGEQKKKEAARKNESFVTFTDDGILSEDDDYDREKKKEEEVEEDEEAEEEESDGAEEEDQDEADGVNGEEGSEEDEESEQDDQDKKEEGKESHVKEQTESSSSSEIGDGGKKLRSSGAAAKNRSNAKYAFKSCSIDNLDNCSRPLLFYGDPDKTTLPETPMQVRHHCNDLKSSVKCSSQWTQKCLQGSARSIVTTMINGPTANIRERCTSQGLIWYLRSRRCIEESRETIDTCMEQLVNGIQAISRNKESEEWVATGCCFFSKFINCFDTALQEKCIKADGLLSLEEVNAKQAEESVKYIQWVRSSMVTNTMNLMCFLDDMDYASEKCQTLIGKTTNSNSSESETLALKIGELKLPSTKSKSLIGSIYELFEKYQEQNSEEGEEGEEEEEEDEKE